MVLLGSLDKMERLKALKTKAENLKLISIMVLVFFGFIWLAFFVVMNKSRSEKNELLIKATIDRLANQTIPSVQTIIDELRSDREKFLEFCARVEKLEGIASKLPPLIRAGGERLPVGDAEKELSEFYFVNTEIPEFSFRQIMYQVYGGD